MGNKRDKGPDPTTVLGPNGSVDVSQREQLSTWYRQSIAVTDVYEIMETLGQGHLGEVYKVKRKVASRGLHNEETRNVNQDILDSSLHNDTAGGSVASFGSARKKWKKKKKKTTPKKKKPIDSASLHSAPELKSPLPPLTGGKPKPILRKPSRGDPVSDVELANSKESEGAKDESPLPKIVSTDNKNIPTMDNEENDDEFEDLKPNLSGSVSAGSAGSSTGNWELDNDVNDDEQEDDQSLSKVSSKQDMFLKATIKIDNLPHGRQSSDVSTDRSIVSPGWKRGSVLPKTDDQYVPRRQVRFQRQYACKTVLTSHIKKGQLEELMNEICIMRALDHPCIIRLYEVYQVKRKLWLVMDLCTGGNLTSRKLNEAEVTVVLEQILRGVAYLHRLDICHRDLKLENILYENSSANSSIRLIDFGLSQKYDQLRNQKDKAIGAAYTLSPEIASSTGRYTQKSDIWSIGVIVWILLAGDFPFMKEMTDLEDKEKKEKLVQANYRFGITWKGRDISQHAKDFVKNCLCREPNDRWSASQALEFLQETWIPALQEKATKEDERIAAFEEKNPQLTKSGKKIIKKKAIDDPTTVLNKAIISKRRSNDEFNISMEGIKKFSEYSRLKKTILITMANTMDRNEVGHLRELFLLADTNNSGTITFTEFKDTIHKIQGSDTADEEIEKLFSAIDHDQSGHVHYNEFVASLAESQGLMSMDRLADAFDRIDTTGKGYISHDDLKAVLGQNYSKEVVDTMIKEADFKKNGKIDYDEFLQLMFETQAALSPS